MAEVLGYADTDQAIRKHCKHAKLFKPVDSTGLDINPRGMNIIPESDVYRLIIRSKLPAAERFERWIMEEVLPSLRKNGGYMMTLPEETPEEVIARALVLGYDHHLARYLDADEQGVTKLMTPGGKQQTKIINESGLYSLILRSHNIDPSRIEQVRATS